ncbi:putative transporter slc-17.2 [Caerostris darwini]|uniref:Transporter slc-17.2 n=1 Tax=Caerostris darwini TaxID=1538125 RepID=A0AAV4RIX4_9ARAC|nr:putative transporter slc-17.2 [Caerostris darwini]
MFNCIPKRYLLSIVALCATTLSIALQTNLSLTIVYMVKPIHKESSLTTLNECSEIRNKINYNATETLEKHTAGQFNWDAEIQGLTIGLQFIGMIIGYIPGGRLGEIYGAKRTMICSLLTASLFTIISPVAARISVFTFIICRMIVGLGAAPIFPILVIMISKWIPDKEQSFVASFMMAGYGTGAFVSSLVAGVLLSSELFGGWPSVFYLSGSIGVVFCIWCSFVVYDSPYLHPSITFKELDYLQNNIAEPPKEIETVPWKSMTTSIPVWTLAIGTFGQYWLLAFFVTSHSMYLGTVLNLDSAQNGLLSSVPNLLRAVFACFIGGMIDWVRRRKEIPIVFVRKGATLFNSIVACLGFTGVLYAGCDSTLNTIAFILGGLCGDFAIFGVALAPSDIAPNLRGTLAGIMSFFGSTPYFLLPWIIGKFTKHEQSLRQWRHIYYCTIAVTVVTTLVYVIFGTTEPQQWGKDDDGHTSNPKTEQQSKQHIEIYSTTDYILDS